MSRRCLVVHPGALGDVLLAPSTKHRLPTNRASHSESSPGSVVSVGGGSGFGFTVGGGGGGGGVVVVVVGTGVVDEVGGTLDVVTSRSASYPSQPVDHRPRRCWRAAASSGAERTSRSTLRRVASRSAPATSPEPETTATSALGRSPRSGAVAL